MHEEGKDKDFVIEMTCACMHPSPFHTIGVCEESGKKHQQVPADLLAEAERLAKAALEEPMDDS